MTFLLDILPGCHSVCCFDYVLSHTFGYRSSQYLREFKETKNSLAGERLRSALQGSFYIVFKEWFGTSSFMTSLISSSEGNEVSANAP